MKFLPGNTSQFHKHICWDGGCPFQDGFMLVGTFSQRAMRHIQQPTAEKPGTIPDAGQAVVSVVRWLALKVIAEASDHLRQCADKSISAEMWLPGNRSCTISKQSGPKGDEIVISFHDRPPSPATQETSNG